MHMLFVAVIIVVSEYLNDKYLSLWLFHRLNTCVPEWC